MLTYSQINLLATLRVLVQDDEAALYQLSCLEETIEADAKRLESLAGDAASSQLLCDELVAESNDLTKQLKAAEELLTDYRNRLITQSEDIANLKEKNRKQNEKHKAAIAQLKGVKKDLGVKDPTRGEPVKKPAKKRGRPIGSTNKPPVEGDSK